MATVAVVGLGMAGTPASPRGCSRRSPTAGINIVAIAQGSSELNISFVVAAKDAAPAQRAIHEAFQLAKIGGGAATRAAAPRRRAAGLRPDRPHAGRHHGEELRAKGSGKSGQNGASKLRLVAAIDRSGFVFDPGGLTARRWRELAAGKQAGAAWRRRRADGPRRRPRRSRSSRSTRSRTRSWST